MTKLRDYLNRWSLTNLKLKTPILEAEIEFNDDIRQAAWALYIEMLTRIAVQPLEEDEGDEKTALASLHSLFETTRKVLKDAGPGAVRFAAIAIPFLNQVLRPLTAKWHPRLIAGDLDTPEGKAEFRRDLKLIRKMINGYVGLVGEIAGVEELDQLLG